MSGDIINFIKEQKCKIIQEKKRLGLEENHIQEVLAQLFFYKLLQK